MQLVILDHPAPDVRFEERGPVDVAKVAAPGKQFVYLGDTPGPEAHGCMGTIVQGRTDPTDSTKYVCDIELNIPPPDSRREL